MKSINKIIDLDYDRNFIIFRFKKLRFLGLSKKLVGYVLRVVLSTSIH